MKGTAFIGGHTNVARRDPSAQNLIVQKRSASFLAGKQQFGAAESVFQEHGNGHRADSAGDGCDPASAFFVGLEIDVADGFFGAVGGGDAVDADVDDDCAFSHVLGGDQVGLAHGDHQDF